ncbi:septal ring lytic transglycosylase RlpA family protein [Alloprevotella sp. OH1205_COT-284]|uniref:septal ring lytic transglycosylase RlpA family protein n=1 Tax=Alloprevotella sp. OH1205_COT-284 TaxID=2491043 RepID=UPI000F5E435C|nr:septal ring lytic transglycosylase RlpA family protein [Alloprevotella sp. OH1205_COT-284]RRD80000.1 septal ring lytic transglycosylase RlpA family protein [Alloprevotella sp. OH1205_COT-284]
MTFKTLFLCSIAVLAFAKLSVAQNETTKVGNATYYGDKWHGRRAADGSIFNQDSLTCAHRTLPFGTLLHVRNPKNGKEVVVRVTDRGPFRRNTVIDLSKAAAKEIDMIRVGVAKVEITKVGFIPKDSEKGQAEETPALPELQLLDPMTGRYFTMTEWQQRANHRREMAKNNVAKQSENFVAKKEQPRYRVQPQRSMAAAQKK